MLKFKSLYAQLLVGKLSHLRNALVAAIIVGLFKVILQYLGVEFLQINSLLAAIISSNIFILGFLLNSTLRDYKEAEKIPAGMATSLETIFDECEIMLSKKKEPIVIEAVQHLLNTEKLCTAWFYKKAHTEEALMHISDFNRYLQKLEPLTQANFIVRMKNEQNSLRKNLIQANILRDTPFYEASYSIARISVFFLLTLLTLLSANPFYEHVFYILVIVFITIFLVSLIKDLDDPFEFNDADIADEVSLIPLSSFAARTRVRMLKLKIKIM